MQGKTFIYLILLSLLTKKEIPPKGIVEVKLKIFNGYFAEVMPLKKIENFNNFLLLFSKTPFLFEN
jgi:hypothetical protein